MSTIIFYFSGSGNSLAVAKSIGSKNGDCILKPIPKAMEEKDFKVSTEKVGFVFPLYYVGIPQIVQEFIKKVDLGEADYVFTVITKAWPVVGGAIDQMKQLLKAKNRKLDAGMYIRMPSNDITFTKVDPPALQKKILEKSPAKIDQLSDIINKGIRKQDRELLWFLWPIRNRPFIKRVNLEDRFFTTDSNCKACGNCVKVCPIDNIKLINQKPQWLGKCQQCLACYHFCPNKAIYYRGQQANGLQYHHPGVKANEISGQKTSFRQ